MQYFKYTVDVNPLGAELNEGRELILSDVLDADAQIDSSLTSVVDPTTGEAIEGAKVSYENVTDENGNPTTKLVVTLPDATPARVCYWVAPNGAAGSEVTLENTAKLSGVVDWKQTHGFVGTVKRANAYTVGTAGSIAITKVDAGDASARLAGAEFSLYRVDMDKLAELGENPSDEDVASISTLVSTATTDANGKVVFDRDGEEELSLYQLYYFKETKAPVVDGKAYEISDASNRYFMLRNIYAETSEEVASDVASYERALERLGASGIVPSSATTYEMRDEKSDEPPTPSTPTTPDTPDTPGTPTTPSTPETPDAPETPSTPDTPTTPDTPSTPDTPMTPGVPAGATTPSTPAADEKGSETPKREVPQTGDTPIRLAIPVSLGAGALATGVWLRRRKRE